MAQDQPARTKPDYDQALKRLLTRAHDGFLALIAPGMIWRGERATELPAVARRADLVWETDDENGNHCLLHIELQTRADDEMGERLTEYKLRLWRRDHLPVQSIVVFLRPTENLPTSPFVIPWKGNASLQSDFDLVKLWEIPPERVLETDNYDLWPLASLMGEASVERVVAIAERISTATPLLPAERSELTGLLVVLAELRLRKRTVIRALRRNPMIDELIRNSSLFEEAKAEGKAEGERRMLALMLEARFGPLGEDFRAAIGSADEAALTAIAQHAATETFEQLRARLGLAN
jgi:hypothetical protein